MKSKKQILEACAKWQKRLNENKCGKYTAKQVRETIRHWKRVCESAENPFDADNIVCSGWVAYLRHGQVQVGLPINFELQSTVATEPDDKDIMVGRKNASSIPHRQANMDMREYGEGIGKTTASFFDSPDEARAAVNAAQIDSGAFFGTSAYLWDAVDAGIMHKKVVRQLEYGDVEIVETFILPDDGIIMGRDCLEDNYREWERDNH